MADNLCEFPIDHPFSERLSHILKTCRTIAIVGLSSEEQRDARG
jgi:predicted CoA-binding protein